MICHLVDAVESSGKPSPAERATGALARFPLKHLVIYILPWPKGKLQSPPDLLVSQPTKWDRDLEHLVAALDCVAAQDPAGFWPDSDVFGKLSGAQWGALLRTHIDHHLRQFGV